MLTSGNNYSNAEEVFSQFMFPDLRTVIFFFIKKGNHAKIVGIRHPTSFFLIEG